MLAMRPEYVRAMSANDKPGACVNFEVIMKDGGLVAKRSLGGGRAVADGRTS